MKQSRFLLLLLVFIFAACQKKHCHKDMETLKQEVAAAEKAFQKMSEANGIAAAFTYYAAPAAVIKRSEHGKEILIQGKENIGQFYSAAHYKSAILKWSPDFIAVAESGDMAYTYGKYTWQSKDSLGKTQEITGLFHTVWEKQKDGTWKYVWD